MNKEEQGWGRGGAEPSGVGAEQRAVPGRSGGGAELGTESEWVVVRAGPGGADPVGWVKLWAEPGELVIVLESGTRAHLGAWRDTARGGPKVDWAGLIAAGPWAPGPESSSACVLYFPSGVWVELRAGHREVGKWYSVLTEEGRRSFQVIDLEGGKLAGVGGGGTGGTEAGSSGSRVSPRRRWGDSRREGAGRGAGASGWPGRLGWLAPQICYSAACIRVLNIQSPSGSPLWSCIILGQVPPGPEGFVVLQELSSRLRLEVE